MSNMNLRFILSGLLGSLLLAGCLAATQPSRGEAVRTSIDGQGSNGISGKVVLKESGRPLEGAYVNIYPDSLSNLLGPSQFISAPTAADGSYRIDLPPGTYYVVARKRMSGDPTGPLSPGDFYSEHERILAEVQAGRLTQVNLEVVPMKAPMFFKKMVVEQESATGFRGRLVDANGNPVAGGFAMAYRDPDMKRLPDFASTLSDSKGRFTLYLPQGGTFYLAARIHAWDMPQPGEPYGIAGDEAPRAYVVETGNFVEDVRIVMSPFSGEYKPGKSRRPY